MRTKDIFVTNTRDVKTVCNGLRQLKNRQRVAEALTEVAALPFSRESMDFRWKVASAGGLESIETILLSSDSDVRLQCKAANALGSLCVSDEVARLVASGRGSKKVLHRLGEMVTSNNQWAQADAIGCLGWLVSTMPSETLHELVPVVTGIMVKNMELDEGNLISQGRHEPDCRAGVAGRVDRRVEQGGRDGQVLSELQAEAMENATRDVARERMDNLRVYSLIFLLKAAHADPSAGRTMVEGGAVPALLNHLSTIARPPTHTPTTSDPTKLGMSRRAEPADEASTLVLSARLLLTFSQTPDLRAPLLKARCVPPLLRVRQSLREDLLSPSGNPSTSKNARRSSLAQSTQALRSGIDGADGGCLQSGGSNGTGAEREGMDASVGDPMSVAGAPAEEHACDAPGREPDLEAVVSMVIDQVLGRGHRPLATRRADTPLGERGPAPRG